MASVLILGILAAIKPAADQWEAHIPFAPVAPADYQSIAKAGLPLWMVAEADAQVRPEWPQLPNETNNKCLSLYISKISGGLHRKSNVYNLFGQKEWKFLSLVIHMDKLFSKTFVNSLLPSVWGYHYCKYFLAW